MTGMRRYCSASACVGRMLSAPAACCADFASTDLGLAAVDLPAPAAIAGANLLAQVLHGLGQIALEAAAASEHTRGGLEEVRLDELHGAIRVACKDRARQRRVLGRDVPVRWHDRRHSAIAVIE